MQNKIIKIMSIGLAMLVFPSNLFSENEITWDEINQEFRKCLAKKDFKQAVKAGELSLIQTEKIFGPNHFDTAKTAFLLGRTYIFTGNHAKAIKYCNKALEIIEKIYGKENSKLEDPLKLLASCYNVQKQYEKASECYKRLISIYKSYYPNGSAGELAYMEDLGEMYLKCKKYKNAEDVFNTALSRYTLFYGENALQMTGLYNDIGMLSHHQKKYEQAINYYDRVYNILKNTHKAGVYDIIAILRNMASLYNDFDKKLYKGKLAEIGNEINKLYAKATILERDKEAIGSFNENYAKNNVEFANAKFNSSDKTNISVDVLNKGDRNIFSVCFVIDYLDDKGESIKVCKIPYLQRVTIENVSLPPKERNNYTMELNENQYPYNLKFTSFKIEPKYCKTDFMMKDGDFNELQQEKQKVSCPHRHMIEAYSPNKHVYCTECNAVYHINVCKIN